MFFSKRKINKAWIRDALSSLFPAPKILQRRMGQRRSWLRKQRQLLIQESFSLTYFY